MSIGTNFIFFPIFDGPVNYFVQIHLNGAN